MKRMTKNEHSKLWHAARKHAIWELQMEECDAKDFGHGEIPHNTQTDMCSGTQVQRNNGLTEMHSRHS